MTSPRQAERTPALFLAHGNPMNALADNGFTRALRRLGKELPRPRLSSSCRRTGSPTVPDHYLPLLYPAATRVSGENVTFPYEGIDVASMSMRCVRFG